MWRDGRLTIWWVIWACIALSLLLVIGHAGMRLGATVFGTEAIVRIWLDTATVVGGFAAAIVAWRSFRDQQQRTDEDRVSTAAGQLASGNATESAAARMSLVQLALRSDNLRQTCLAVLIGSIEDQDREAFRWLNIRKPGDLFKLPEQTRSANLTLNAIGKIWASRYHHWMRLPEGETECLITNALHVNGVFHQINLGRSTVNYAFMGDVTFHDCGLADTKWAILVTGRIVIEKCNLQNCHIQFFGQGGWELGQKLVVLKDNSGEGQVFMDGDIASSSNKVQIIDSTAS